MRAGPPRRPTSWRAGSCSGSKLTVLGGGASVQVVTEAERNLAVKVPAAVEALRELVDACVQVVADPEPGEVRTIDGRTHPKDLPVLVSAVRERCDVLVTFNEKDFRPGHSDVEVVTPGVLVQPVRRLVALAGRGG